MPHGFLRVQWLGVDGSGNSSLHWDLWEEGGVEARTGDIKIIGVDDSLNHVVEVGNGSAVEVVQVQDELADGIAIAEGELSDPSFT